MTAYYNERDAFKAAVIREAIKAGALPAGEVDERSIADVAVDDLRGFRQCHFFAGGGFWALALRLAGWPDDREVWTGSCPCQPFSVAGKREGFDDERHLWPEWLRLIKACGPETIFGEQVSAAIRGSSYEGTNLPEVRGREAILRVLHELQRSTPSIMQRVLSGRGEDSQAVSPAKGQGSVFGLEEEEARLCVGECGEVSRKDETPSMHTGPGGNSGSNRAWRLRDHGDSVRSYQASLVELAIPGQDRSDEWLHTREHARRSLFLECDGERLGNAKSGGDGQCDPRAAYKAERRIQRTLERCFEGSLGESWLDLVCDGLEAEGYTIGASVLGAHSTGAPHIRQRLYFCAHATNERLDGRRSSETSAGTFESERSRDAGDGAAGERQQPIGAGLEGHFGDVREWRGPGWLDPHEARSIATAGATRGFWSDCDWWYGRDGKYRPIEPGIFPLVTRDTARVGRLRMYGDAICVPIAQAFIESYVEAK